MPFFSQSLITLMGPISVYSNEEAITKILFELAPEERPNSLTNMAMIQLEEYFDSSRKQFSVPIQPEGSSFQHLVWNELQQIEWGHTKSYGEIAHRIGKPGASRAVGNANNKNPIPIIIPCHRVIGRTGQLTGYAGGLEIKSQLLQHESKNIPLNFGEPDSWQ